MATTRKLIADPAPPHKLKTGRPGLVRPCLLLLYLHRFSWAHLRCAVNAQGGDELSAPRTLACTTRSGGWPVVFSSFVHCGNGRLIDYAARQMETRDMRVHPDSPVTAATVQRMAPVAVTEPGASFGKKLMKVRRWRLRDTLRKGKVVPLPSSLNGVSREVHCIGDAYVLGYIGRRHQDRQPVGAGALKKEKS